MVENTPEFWTAAAERPFSWEAAGWSQLGQHERFVAVRSHLRFGGGFESVLDFGAGTGEFSRFLPVQTPYHAVDWSEGMRRRCRREHPHATISESLPDGTFDYVVAVGAFNLPGSHADNYVDALWARTGETLVLSLYHGLDERCIRYEPSDLLEWIDELEPARWSIEAHRHNDLLLVMHR